MFYKVNNFKDFQTSLMEKDSSDPLFGFNPFYKVRDLSTALLMMTKCHKLTVLKVIKHIFNGIGLYKIYLANLFL